VRNLARNEPGSGGLRLVLFDGCDDLGRSAAACAIIAAGLGLAAVVYPPLALAAATMAVCAAVVGAVYWAFCA
ncbi:MAG: hypothetical protein M3Y07_11740, partial [Acidobacteriota bacterium]|nr:hypothetical protein [Acidobacteriota bacterium]